MAKRGRPTRITTALTRAICANLEIAMPLKLAAEAEGVAESTVHYWLDKAKSGEEPFAAFSGAVTRAKAIGVRKLTERALEGGKGSQHATWLLERRHRADYGPVQRFEHSGPDGAAISIEIDDISKLSDDELRAIAARNG